jgi:hypothetical protein
MKPAQLGPIEGANLNHCTSKIKRQKWNETYLVGPLEGANLNHWTSKLKG